MFCACDRSAFPVPRGFTVLVVGGLMCLGFVSSGCQSGKQDVKQDDSTVRVGGEKYRVRDLRSGGQSLRITDKERRQIRRTVAELATEFSSDDPSVWEEAAKKIKKLGSRFAPDIVLKKVEVATKSGEKGMRAREQLVRWGSLQSIMLELPSKNEKTWDRVRKRMFEKGAHGKEMFISHMLGFLRKPDRNRTLAAKQLARSGTPAVRNAWSTVRKLAKKARRVTRKEKALEGVMITIEGLCEVIVFAENWRLVDRALRQDSFRIRIGMVQALGKSRAPSRAIERLASIVRDDPNRWVRIEAVSALEVFSEQEKAVEALRPALKDKRPAVAKLAAKKLRNFPSLEEKVLELLIDTLRSDRWKNMSEEVREQVFSTLRDVAESPPSGDRVQVWLTWYRNRTEE